MSVVFSNNAVTTLANALDSTSTSMTVVDGSQFPAISGSNFTFVTLQDISQNREIVKVTNISGNVFTIVLLVHGALSVTVLGVLGGGCSWEASSVLDF